LGAALLLILIAAGAAGFYAYRARKQGQANPSSDASSPAPLESSQPAQSEPANVSVQVDPVKTNDSKIDKKVDSSKRTATSKKTPEKPVESEPARDQPPIPPSTAHDPSRDPNRDPKQERPKFPSSQDPRFDPFRNPRGRQQPHPPGADQPNVRTLPNGTRIVLFENRGALSTNGLGSVNTSVNSLGLPVFAVTNMATFYTNSFEEAPVGLYMPGAEFQDWNVLTNSVAVVRDLAARNAGVPGSVLAASEVSPSEKQLV